MGDYEMLYHDLCTHSYPDEQGWRSSVAYWAASKVAAEREACAKVAEKIWQYCQNVAGSSEVQMLYPQTAAGNQYAATRLSEVIAAIRARGEE